MQEQHYDERVIEALERMEATQLGAYEGADISKVIRNVKQRRGRVQAELTALVADLDQVAALLRVFNDTPEAATRAAREEIAVDFAAGALAVERARLSLEIATKDLEYLRYMLL